MGAWKKPAPVGEAAAAAERSAPSAAPPPQAQRHFAPAASTAKPSLAPSFLVEGTPPASPPNSKQ